MALAEVAGPRSGPWLGAAAALGSARNLLEAGDAELSGLGLNAAGRVRLRARPGDEFFRRRRDHCDRLGIGLLGFDCAGYPPLLREIPDPPLLLYCRGQAPAAALAAVAMVGSRKATRYGKRTAAALAETIAGSGLTVVSGLALGIDGAAHEGALRSGSTVAVLAGGLDRIYPSRHRELFFRVIEQGCALSEHPPGTVCLPRNFPVRNRIITGVSLATVVVEAGGRSGSLISARLALEQGREVLAVPGNIDSAASEGSNRLLRDGCTPLLEAEDIFRALGMPPPKPAGGGPESLNTNENKSLPDPDEAALMAVLEAGECTVDQLISGLPFDGARVMELLTALELAGLVESMPGGTVCRVNISRV